MKDHDKLIKKTHRNKNKISAYNRIITKIRYNLFLQVIRNQLAKTGLELTPFYLVQVGMHEIEKPEIKLPDVKITSGFLNNEEIKYIAEKSRGYTEKIFNDRIKEGKKCFGLKNNNEIIAFIWIDQEECNFKPSRFRLKENEAYIFSMYTMEEYRGKNAAPLLAYHLYKELKTNGRNTIYSISEFFNFSAIRYKRKLKAMNLKLILYAELFKFIRFKVTIRKYRNNQ